MDGAGTAARRERQAHAFILQCGRRMCSARAGRGFTLIEMMVAVTLFSVVMLVAVSTLLALVAANRKAQSTQLVIDNLNMALDGMERSIRTGTHYHCGDSPYLTTRDCPSGNTTFAFEPFGYPATNIIVYRFDSSGTICGQSHALCKSTDGGVTFLPITAPEVSIDSLTFYVVGSTSGKADSSDTQPKVVIVVKESASLGQSATKSTFHVQLTATQRVIDI